MPESVTVHAKRVIGASGLAALAGGAIMFVETYSLNGDLGVAALFGIGAICVVFPSAMLLGIPLYGSQLRYPGKAGWCLGAYLLVGTAGSVLVMRVLFPMALEGVRHNNQLIVFPALIGLGASLMAWLTVTFGPLRISRG